MNEYDRYTYRIVNELLQLQAGEDLFINFEKKLLFFARLVKDAALAVTHRPVTLVMMSLGRPCGIAPYDPEDFCLPQSKGKAMLHLEKPSKLLSAANDFDEISKDMRTMMEYGHLSEPLILGRRIAVPWCSVPCFEENDVEGWGSFLSSRLFISGSVPSAHKDRCDSINLLKLRQLDILDGTSRLTLTLSDSSHFIGRHVELNETRSFFSGVETDALSINLDSRNCNGEAKVRTSLVGNRIDCQVIFTEGRLIPNSMDPSQRFFSRFFLLEEDSNRISSMTITADGIYLMLGSSILESMNIIPSDERELPSDFMRNVYQIKLELKPDRIEGITSHDEKMLLMNRGKLLI